MVWQVVTTNTPIMWPCLIRAVPTPEECLQVIRQLGAASIAGVHGDVHRAAGVQLNLSVLEDKALDLGLNGQLDGQDLLCHHRQHFQINAVELVKTGPSPGRCQTLQGTPRRPLTSVPLLIGKDRMMAV